MKPFPNRTQLSIYRLDMSPDSVAPVLSAPACRFTQLPQGVEGQSAGFVGRDHPDEPPTMEDLLHAVIDSRRKQPGVVPLSVIAWWRVRVDSRKVPKHLIDLAIERAERARGKRLSNRERREIGAQVKEQVLPTLPCVTRFCHVIATGTHLLLCSTSKSVRESLLNLCAGFPKLAHDDWSAPNGEPAHPIAILLMTAGGMGPDGEMPRVANRANLVAALDGAIRVEHEDDAVTIEGETPPVRQDRFWSLLRDDYHLSRIRCTVAFDPERQDGGVYKIALDAVKGGLSVDMSANDLAGGEDPVDVSEFRLGHLVGFASRWSDLVKEAAERASDNAAWLDAVLESANNQDDDDE